MNVTITREDIQLSPGADIVLRNQSWTDYETLLERRGDRPTPKIYFDAKTQEIRLMAPSPRHGNRSRALSRFVECLLEYQERDYQNYDPITLKKLDEKGVEPDSCFYIANWKAVLGKEKINLEVDPPPDLALEVDLTSLTRPQDYESIGSPELWIYREARLSVYVFEQGHYVEQVDSPTFPNISVTALIPEYVEKAWHEGTSVAVREFKALVAQTLG